MVVMDLAKGGLYMKTERITTKVGNAYYIKAKFELEDALNKLGRLEDEEEKEEDKK